MLTYIKIFTIALQVKWILILADKFARKAVACYLVMFERKSKYDQDSIIVEWFRYSTLAEREATPEVPTKELQTTTTSHMMVVMLITTRVSRSSKIIGYALQGCKQ